MSDSNADEAEKSHEPTPQKLHRARKKGEIARAPDLSVSAGYAGLLLAIIAFAADSTQSLGATLMIFFDQPDRLLGKGPDGAATAVIGRVMARVAWDIAPWFAIPMLAVLLTILAQRAFVVAPEKLSPKASRISLLANAKNKFGRAGLFGFAKSFFKLVLYSVILAGFLKANLPLMVVAASSDPASVVKLLGYLGTKFLTLVLAIALAIGVVDAIWQHFEHLRKNRMSRKELLDETKDAEGDPHMKQKRMQKGQEIAANRMLSDVPSADVVVVNPTHYAVALKWSRLPGAAPVCVAKGVDEIALAIRAAAEKAGVPIHSDPPTARALHASVDIGKEISEGQYRTVAAAIRFAEEMRRRARGAIR